MKTTKKIVSAPSLRSLLLLLTMLLLGSVNGWSDEKLLYSTDFTDWPNLDRMSTVNKVVNLKTRFSNEKFTFTLNGVGSDPIGYNGKFSSYTGYMITAKYPGEYTKAEPSAVTSPLASVTQIVLRQAATGGNRGIKVSVKGDGDADWVILHDKSIDTKKEPGNPLSIKVNRTNCQIKFENYNDNRPADKNPSHLNQNAYLVDLKIYGNVDAKSFKDFKIDFRKNPYSVVEPADGLPEGVKLTDGTFNDPQHGYKYAKLTVPVDGPVKFMIGACCLTDHATVSVDGGTPMVINTKSENCEGRNDFSNYVTYVYNSEEKAVLTFDLGDYCPYFIAEACEYVPHTVVFSAVDGVTGSYPQKIECDRDGNAVMPHGKFLQCNGYTFEGWTDGTTDYQPGQQYTFTEETTILKPKMRKDDYDLTDANKETTVVWPFDHTEAPAINIFSSNILKSMPYAQYAGVYINKTTQEQQDLALTINTKQGKVDNTDEQVNALAGKGALVKDGVAFSIPAVYGMKVVFHASDKVDAQGVKTVFDTAETDAQITMTDGTETQDMTNATLSDDGKTLTFTYNGDAQTLTFTMVKAGSTTETYGFLDNITATYPVLPNVVCVNTISNADPDNFPNEKAENTGSVTIDLVANDQVKHDNLGKRYKVGDVGELAEKAHRCSVEICKKIQAMARPDVSARSLYETAVEMAEEAGLSDYFMGHVQKAGFIGHGVGIEVNELPVLSARSKDVLEQGNVIALEPKFVIPHVGAVGIENTYVITADGAECITVMPEELIQLSE